MAVATIRQPEFGQRLRRLRLGRRLSQRDAAGGVVNPSYISLLESGARVPTLEVVVRLAAVLSVPLAELLGRGSLSAAAGLPSAAPDERLVQSVLAASAREFGDLGAAQARSRNAYDRAVREHDMLAVVEHGLALQEILLRRSAHQARYDLVARLTQDTVTVDVPEVQVRLLIDRASAARDLDRVAEAAELVHCAVDRIGVTRLAGTSEHVRLLGVLISMRCETGDPAEVAHLVGSMLRIATTVDSRSVLGHAHWVACQAFATIGEPELARQHLRQAKQALATPEISVRDLARFSRAAAAALLDAHADPVEVEQYLGAARTALSMIDLPGELPRLRALEARWALACGRPERALELSETEPKGLPRADLVRLRVARGLALHAVGRPDEAAAHLRATVELCEQLGAVRQAVQIRREIDGLDG